MKRNEAKELQPPGILYGVRDFKMHLWRVGPINRLPAVLIEAGNSMSAAAYFRLQSALASRVHVVTYDRAGLGWSDDNSDARDAEHIGDHLHALLDEAEIRRPLVIAGHSIGGLLLRAYAGRYPGDIGGVAFLDATHPQIDQLYEADERTERVREFYQAQKRCVETGELHESDASFIETFADLPGIQQQLRYAAAQSRRYDVAIETMEAFRASARQAEASGDLGDRPVVSITAAAPVSVDWLPRSGLETYRAGKRSLHQELAGLSTRGKHIEWLDAEHGALIYDPRLVARVANEILQVVYAVGER